MTRMKDFNKRFGIQTNLASAQHKFILRIDVTLESIKSYFESVQFVTWLSLEYGERLDTVYTDLWENGTRTMRSGFNLSRIHKGDFVSCLKLLESLYAYSKENSPPDAIELLELSIKNAIERSDTDLGIRWHDGKFLQSGAKELDEKLVIDVLDWLNGYPAEKLDFDKAIKALIAKRYNDVIGDCNTCLEGVARKVLNNKKQIEKNKDDLLKLLSLSDPWGRIFAGYIDYANEFGKHASDERHKVNPNEAEAFLYMTGLAIRLIANVVREKKAKGNG